MPGVQDRIATAYEDDFHAWALHQADGLRALARDRANLPLDLDNLAEEVEGLARAERAACRSQVRRIIENFLKLQWSGAAGPRAGWTHSIMEARAVLEDKLTATLRIDLLEQLGEQYRKARRLAAAGLEAHGDHAAAARLPERCPYTLEQILSEDWYPDPSAAGR